jgi:hypothetical protein
VKRGDYLIVSGDDEYTISREASSEVSQFRVEHILYRDQVRHIKNNALWPSIFEDKDEIRHSSIQETSSRMAASIEPPASQEPSAANSKKLVVGANNFGLMNDADPNESESEEESGAELFVNTNRRQMKQAAPDSSSDEDEEE